MKAEDSQPMLGIVLFAHGSRDPLWHKPVQAIADTIRAKAANARVACAYLEWSTPDLPTACAALIDAGARSLRVVPLFLGVGKHAREDLPVLMAQLRERWPHIVFELQAAVGEDQRLVSLLADIALEPGIQK